MLINDQVEHSPEVDYEDLPDLESVTESDDSEEDDHPIGRTGDYTRLITAFLNLILDPDNALNLMLQQREELLGLIEEVERFRQEQ
ncbi:hypothetical protein GALMADRAFT_141608 [Galerina marginata CBS 339.88]|uniref:Uncharacterized protein n=1 Tax=Galerina marginata (strain CBS 339.88) TaxID=685588 RepID=A0A067SSF5_GALM3|nr:hypothetical protein GALMADRAFT_141608 [Galerina marginata CBS 339.88]